MIKSYIVKFNINLEIEAILMIVIGLFFYAEK